MDANDLVEKSKVIGVIDNYLEYREPFDEGVYAAFKELCSIESGMHLLMTTMIDHVKQELKEKINEL